jgi:lipopolysaccharide export LptBFGC system permease protein LptF
MSFIFFLLLFFLFFAFFIVAFILRFFGAIFHIGRNRHENKAHQEENNTKTSSKVFTKEEGEYVDFEEIKDDEMNRYK